MRSHMAMWIHPVELAGIYPVSWGAPHEAIASSHELRTQYHLLSQVSKIALDFMYGGKARHFPQLGSAHWIHSTFWFGSILKFLPALVLPSFFSASSIAFSLVTQYLKYGRSCFQWVWKSTSYNVNIGLSCCYWHKKYDTALKPRLLTFVSRWDILPCLSGASTFILHSGFLRSSTPPPSHSTCSVKSLTTLAFPFALELGGLPSTRCSITSMTTAAYHPSGNGGSGGHLMATSSPIWGVEWHEWDQLDMSASGHNKSFSSRTYI